MPILRPFLISFMLLAMLVLLSLPAVGSPSPDELSSERYQVDGRFLYDPYGERVIVRGLENVFGWGLSQKGEYIDEITKTGANALRILPNASQLSADDVEKLIVRAISNNMIPYISPIHLSVGSAVDWFLRDDISELLSRYSKHVIIDAVGESTLSTDSAWVAYAKQSIARMREAGYENPLVIISREYGRDPRPVLRHGLEILETDPLRNVIFGVQVYWTDWYLRRYGMTVEEALSEFAAQDFKIQVGVCPGNNEIWAGAYDYGEVIEQSHRYELSWLHWDWHNPYGGSNSLSADGTYGNWRSEPENPHGADYGAWIAVESPYSVQSTAVRNQFLLDAAEAMDGSEKTD